MPPPWKPVPGVQGDGAKPLARPGEVEKTGRDVRGLARRFEDGQRFDVVTWDGAFPRHGSLILVDATAGPVTVPLPAAAKQRDRTITIKKIDASANAVTVDADGADLIDGAGTFALAGQWATVTMACDGDNWWLI